MQSAPTRNALLNTIINPYLSPGDAKIAPDWFCLRVPATMSIAIAMVEQARARRQNQDQRGRIKRSGLGGKSSSITIVY